MARLLWTLKQHVGPAPRARHASAFDTQRGRTVLFGGDSLQGAIFSDTWEWDGENWTQLNDVGPPPRFFAAMAYDASRSRTVLFGGTGNAGALADTWEWNGEDWTQMADSGPSARAGHAMVFDSARNRIVLFGGIAGDGLLGDTWEWDGDEWTQTEDVGPSPRRSHAMTFDAPRGRVVLFGGFSGTAALGDTWEFDGVAWTQMAAFGPPPCIDATLIHNGRRALLFGGASALTGSQSLFHLTWEWDGRHWTVRQDMGPGDWWAHTMVFDTGRNRGVLFGGTGSLPEAAAQVASGNTWEQFEQGAAGPGPDPDQPPEGDVQVVGITVDPPQPVEGVPFAVEATLSAEPPLDTQVEFTITDIGGADLLGFAMQAPVSGTTARFEPFALAAGEYIFTAALGDSSQSVQFQITPNDSQLGALTITPPNASPGVPFTLMALVSSPAPDSGMRIPLSVEFGEIGGLWAGQQLEILPGETTGTLTIDPASFGGDGSNPLTGDLTFNGTLGGGTASATVTLS